MRRDEQAVSHIGHAFTIDAFDYNRYDALADRCAAHGTGH